MKYLRWLLLCCYDCTNGVFEMVVGMLVGLC